MPELFPVISALPACLPACLTGLSPTHQMSFGKEYVPLQKSWAWFLMAWPGREKKPTPSRSWFSQLFFLSRGLSGHFFTSKCKVEWREVTRVRCVTWNSLVSLICPSSYSLSGSLWGFWTDAEIQTLTPALNMFIGIVRESPLFNVDSCTKTFMNIYKYDHKSKNN